MNIFVLDSNPSVAAQMHCDKHVVKMCIELAQLLSCAHHAEEKPFYPTELYAPTHTKHPCAIWTRATGANYRWAHEHWLALLAEYSLRFNRQHGSSKLARYLRFTPESLRDSYVLTPHAIAMPAGYRTPYNAVESYRRYYALGKIAITTWKSGTPQWYLDDIKKYGSEKEKFLCASQR